MSHDLHGRCPFCDYAFDRASYTAPGEPTPPAPDDFSLCIKCGEWLVFDDDLQMRKPNAAEYGEIVKRADMSELRLVWEKVIKK